MTTNTKNDLLAFGALLSVLIAAVVASASATIVRVLPSRTPADCAETVDCLNLVSQQSMVVATFFMAWLTCAALIVGVVTLWFLWRTVLHTRNAAYSASESVHEARKATASAELAASAAQTTVEETRYNAQAQLRAYVGLDSHILVLVREPAAHTLNMLGYQGVLKNAGQTPANVLELHTVAVVVAPDVDRPFATFVPDSKLSYGTLLPGSHVRLAFALFTLEELRELSEQSKRAFIMGYVQYTDTFSLNLPREERFCIEVFVRAPFDVLLSAFNDSMVTTNNYGWFDYVAAAGPPPDKSNSSH